MKRACIYVVFDKQKKINPYIRLVLSELIKFASDIYVVCNFDEILSGLDYIKPFVKSINCRNNVGFDAGAYKEMLNEVIGWDRILQYDELILTNDTYFAPIYPFDDMFRTMQKTDCDYWGMTRHPKGFLDGYGIFEEHIQSYFLCFKRDVVHNEKFKLFWTEFKLGDDKNSTIAGFELGINSCLTRMGYIGKAYMDQKPDFNIEIENANPYSRYAYELIRDAKMPIIKKTNFYGKNRWLMNTFEAADFIDKNTDYDMCLIWDYVDEYQKKGLMGPYYDFEDMESFVKSHKKIYIYGAGIWGEITAGYFKRKNWQFVCFLTTTDGEGEMAGKPIRLFSETEIYDDDGIIIAQEFKENCDEIIEYMGDSYKSQIFTPCYSENV